MTAEEHANNAETPLPNAVYSLSDIAALAAPVLDECGFVKRAYVYGSYGRGEARPESDVDIALVLDFSAHVGGSDVSELRFQLEEALAKDVDVATIHSTALAHRPFQAEIERDGQLVYDCESRA